MPLPPATPPAPAAPTGAAAAGRGGAAPGPGRGGGCRLSGRPPDPTRWWRLPALSAAAARRGSVGARRAAVTGGRAGTGRPAAGPGHGHGLDLVAHGRHEGGHQHEEDGEAEQRPVAPHQPGGGGGRRGRGRRKAHEMLRDARRRWKASAAARAATVSRARAADGQRPPALAAGDVARCRPEQAGRVGVGHLLAGGTGAGAGAQSGVRGGTGRASQPGAGRDSEVSGQARARRRHR